MEGSVGTIPAPINRSPLNRAVRTIPRTLPCVNAASTVRCCLCSPGWDVGNSSAILACRDAAGGVGLTQTKHAAGKPAWWRPHSRLGLRWTALA